MLSEYGEYFLNQGFIVELARDGVEGLEKLRRDKEFDVALISLKMPSAGKRKFPYHSKV